jgi:hypothetical protein
MILMGIVKAAYPTHLYISLPGRLVGKVSITNISRSYSKLLQTILENQDLTTVRRTKIVGIGRCFNNANFIISETKIVS